MNTWILQCLHTVILRFLPVTDITTLFFKFHRRTQQLIIIAFSLIIQYEWSNTYRSLRAHALSIKYLSNQNVFRSKPHRIMQFSIRMVKRHVISNLFQPDLIIYKNIYFPILLETRMSFRICHLVVWVINI